MLGLQPVEETRLDNWVEFSGPGSRFSLHAVPPAIAAGIEIESPPRARDQGATKLIFDIMDVEATLAQIEALGLPLLRRPWGETEGVDPEGNVSSGSALQSSATGHQLPASSGPADPPRDARWAARRPAACR